jgi:hypothetical protein
MQYGFQTACYSPATDMYGCTQHIKNRCTLIFGTAAAVLVGATAEPSAKERYPLHGGAHIGEL